MDATPGTDATIMDVATGDAADSGTSRDAIASMEGGDVLVPNDGPAVLSGSVQKGPFVLGSTLTLSAIHTSASATGQTFTTQTSTDLGDFSVSFDYRGNVDIQAQGFYYDEVSGALSTAPIVLRALFDVSNGGPQNAHVNIVTHLAHDRAIKLMAAGMSLAAAEAKAESELVTMLGIGGAGFQPGGVGIQLDELGPNSDANAYLFAVSAVLVQLAREQAGDGGPIDATLQQLANTIAADLATGGQLSAPLASELRAAEQDLDVDLTMDLLASRLKATGSSGVPASLNRAIDSDGDGYRNSIDTCPLVANPNQSQVPAGVICKVTRHTTFPPAMQVGYPVGLAGDFTNAGHLGLFAGGFGAGALFVGDGSGRFSMIQAKVPVGLVPTAALDVNQDGYLDLVFGNNRVWSPGDGVGNFASTLPLPALPQGSDGGTLVGGSALVVDVNGDGLPDVVEVPTTNGISAAGLSVALGTTKGAFGPAVLLHPFPNGWEGPGCCTLLAGDVNGDGHLDLVALVDLPQPSGPQQEVVALLGNGAGAFQAAVPTPLLGPNQGTGQALLADFDGDGHLDLGGLSPVLIAFGDGSGGFGPIVSDPNIRSGNVGLAADFNGDGKADFAFLQIDTTNSSVPGGHLSVLLSQGRSLGSPQRLRSTPLADNQSSFASGDLNGDGIPDLLVVADDLSGSSTPTIQALVMNVLQ